QVMPGRSLQVVCIRPSGKTSQEPRSVDGISLASSGVRSPSPPTIERPGATRPSSSGRPGVAVPAGLMCVLIPGGSPAIAITSRFGTWFAGTVADDADDVGLGAGAQAATAN